MHRFVLLRHGQSQWNLENRFTGWVDVSLSPAGEAEATRAGQLLGAEGLQFERAFTSVLARAIRTSDIALAVVEQLWIPVSKDWRLNERHYGGLTGLNKAEMAAVHGEDQVRRWRRSYDVSPPPAAKGGPFDFSTDRRYACAVVPLAESLKTTLERVLPCWRTVIEPSLAAGETLLISAHGNSLRAILKHIFDVSDEAIAGVDVPTGNPLLIELDSKLFPRAARYLDVDRAKPLPPLH